MTYGKTSGRRSMTREEQRLLRELDRAESRAWAAEECLRQARALAADWVAAGDLWEKKCGRAMLDELNGTDQ